LIRDVEDAFIDGIPVTYSRDVAGIPPGPAVIYCLGQEIIQLNLK
jgi:hypothetical protein